MGRSLLVPAALTMSILWQGGCGRPPSGTPAATAGGATAVAPAGESPTDEEALAFAEEFADAVNRADAGAMNRLIDWEGMLEQATSGVDVPAAMRQGFADGFIQKAGEADGGVVWSIIQAIEQGGSYTFMGMVGGKGKQVARFRLLDPEGGINYHEAELWRRPGGPARAVDLFIYTAGVSIRQGVRNIFLSMVAENRRSLIDRLTGKEQVFLKHLPTLSRMNEDLTQGRPEAVLAAYRSLPDELQRDRFFLVARFTAAQQVDDAEYLAALDAFREAFPDDACVDMLSIDAHFLRGRHDEALAAIDRLDRAVGGDPYLDVHRSSILADRGDLEAAREAASRAREADPGLIDAYWSLISISMRRRDFGETARLLDEIAATFDLVFDDLTTIPDYAEFVRSPEYQEWLSRRPEAGSAGGEPTPTGGVPDF